MAIHAGPTRSAARRRTTPDRGTAPRPATRAPQPPWLPSRPIAPAPAFEAAGRKDRDRETPGGRGHATATPPAELPRPNRTGLPDGLKAGVEALSGLAMDDVRVHRNSAEPARFGALAFAQGSDIHLGPGQEQHLPHETWHVVQQKQRRVTATTQMKGVNVNEDAGLEREADLAGARAAAFGDPIGSGRAAPLPEKRPPTSAVAQRTVRFRQDAGTTSEPDLSQILRWLAQGGIAVTPEIRGRVLVMLRSPNEVTVPWLYGQSEFMEALEGEIPRVDPTQTRPLRAIAPAFGAWLAQWAPRGPTDEAKQRLRDRWAEAADDLEGYLYAAGVDARPGNAEARQTNRNRFPTRNGIWLIDMLTVLHDLRDWGPRREFLPEKPIEDALKWFNLFRGQ